MTTQTTSYKTVLQTIQNWPVSNQINLVQDILQNMVSELDAKPSHKDTLSDALGLLANDKRPPSDEEVKEWLAERRLKKYGFL